MTPDEYISISGMELTKVDNPVAFLAEFYCNIFGITRFKELYPAIGKLIKQFGEGRVFKAIVDNYYKSSKHSKKYFYTNLLFTMMNMEKNDKIADAEPTPISYTEYSKLRESVNV